MYPASEASLKPSALQETTHLFCIDQPLLGELFYSVFLRHGRRDRRAATATSYLLRKQASVWSSILNLADASSVWLDVPSRLGCY